MYAQNGTKWSCILRNDEFMLLLLKWFRLDLILCLFLFSITRTFASGKTEKLVMQHLKALGFASGKVK